MVDKGSAWTACEKNKDFAAHNSWQWLRRGSFIHHTKSVITAAHQQALGTIYKKQKLNTQENWQRVECARPEIKR